MLLEMHFTTCELSRKNALFNQKFPLARLLITGVELSFKNQNIAVDKPNGKTNYSEYSDRLKLLGLPHMIKPGKEPGSQNFNKDVLLITRLISVEISPWWSLQH